MTIDHTRVATVKISDGWSPRLIVALACMVLVLELLSASYLMVSMALPIMADAFQTAHGAWILTAFLLFGALASPVAGKLADMQGKRLLLLCCITLAAIGAVVTVLAPSFWTMIVGRALTGALIPCLFLTYSLIRDVFPEHTIPLSVSIATSGMGLIAIPTPFATGWLLESFGWPSIFWLTAILLVVFGVGISLTTPETDLRVHGHLDVWSALLLGGGLAAILAALSFSLSWGWVDAKTLVLLLGGIALVGLWPVVARRVREPLIDMEMLSRRPVLMTVVAAGFIQGVGTMYVLLLPMIAFVPSQAPVAYGFGMDATSFAIFHVLTGGFTMVGGLVTGVLVGKGTPPRMTLAAAMILTCAGSIVAAFTFTTIPVLLVCSAVVGLGMGLGYSSIPNLLIQVVPADEQASIASLAGIMQALIPAILPVVTFTMLNTAFIALSSAQTGAAPLYSAGGFVAAFFLTAGAALIGLVLALLIPRKLERAQVPSSAGSMH